MKPKQPTHQNKTTVTAVETVEQPPIPTTGRFIPLSVFAIGAVACSLLCCLLIAQQGQTRQALFESRAEQRKKLVGKQLKLAFENLFATAALYQASEAVTEAEFTEFVSGTLHGDNGLEGIAWVR